MDIKIICWTCQGDASSKFSAILHNMLLYHKSNILVLLETRISGKKVDDIIRSTRFDYSFKVEAKGFSRGIWVLWKENLRVNVIAVSDQVVHYYCSKKGANHSILFTTVYASPNTSKHKLLWDYIASLRPQVSISWILEGDFNAIISSDERKGGAKVLLGGDVLFRYFIFEGLSYTWSRGLLFQRLDRFLCNLEWMEVYPGSSVAHLQCLGSDHHPICLSSMLRSFNTMNRLFRFIATWMDHEQFDTILKSFWRVENSVVSNIDNFYSIIKDWNIKSFGYRKKVLLARLKGIKARLDCYPSYFLRNLEK